MGKCWRQRRCGRRAWNREGLTRGWGKTPATLRHDRNRDGQAIDQKTERQDRDCYHCDEMFVHLVVLHVHHITEKPKVRQ